MAYDRQSAEAKEVKKTEDSKKPKDNTNIQYIEDGGGWQVSPMEPESPEDCRAMVPFKNYYDILVEGRLSTHPAFKDSVDYMGDVSMIDFDPGDVTSAGVSEGIINAMCFFEAGLTWKDHYPRKFLVGYGNDCGHKTYGIGLLYMPDRSSGHSFLDQVKPVCGEDELRKLYLQHFRVRRNFVDAFIRKHNISLNQDQIDAMVMAWFGLGQFTKYACAQAIARNPNDRRIWDLWMRQGRMDLAGLVRRRNFERHWYFGMHGTSDVPSWVLAGASYGKTVTPAGMPGGSQKVSQPGTFNPAAAASKAWNRAYASSIGKCAQFVREALNACGFKTPNNPEKAKGYIQKLPEYGYPCICVLPDERAYKKYIESSACVGDIAVYEKPRHPGAAGHICICCGKSAWVSDFKQGSAWVYYYICPPRNIYIFRYKGAALSGFSSRVATHPPKATEEVWKEDILKSPRILKGIQDIARAIRNNPRFMRKIKNKKQKSR